MENPVVCEHRLVLQRWSEGVHRDIPAREDRDHAGHALGFPHIHVQNAQLTEYRPFDAGVYHMGHGEIRDVASLAEHVSATVLPWHALTHRRRLLA